MLFVNIAGIALILLVIWWFWLYKPKEAQLAEGVVNIMVENGTYSPSRIKLPAGKAATIQFHRKDETPCAGTVLFADFDISEELPLDRNKSVTLPNLSPGEYEFSCQMQMYKGKLIVE